MLQNNPILLHNTVCNLHTVPNKETKAEKYCLNVKNDIEQIILYIDFAAKAGFERGHYIFNIDKFQHLISILAAN